MSRRSAIGLLAGILLLGCIALGAVSFFTYRAGRGVYDSLNNKSNEYYAELAIRPFMDKVQSRDTRGAYDYLSPDVQAKLPKPRFDAALAVGGAHEIEAAFREAGISGTPGTRVPLGRNECGQNVVDLWTVKQGKVWKIANVTEPVWNPTASPGCTPVAGE